MQDKVRRHPACHKRVAGFCQVSSHLFSVYHASLGYKWPVSWNWVSLPVESPMAKGLLLCRPAHPQLPPPRTNHPSQPQPPACLTLPISCHPLDLKGLCLAGASDCSRGKPRWIHYCPLLPSRQHPQAVHGNTKLPLLGRQGAPPAHTGTHSQPSSLVPRVQRISKRVNPPP